MSKILVNPPTDIDVEIVVPQVQGAHTAAQKEGGFFSSVFGLLGLNIGPIIAIGSKIVQDIVSLVSGQKVFDTIRGIKLGGNKWRVMIWIEQDQGDPPQWPPAGVH